MIKVWHQHLWFGVTLLLSLARWLGLVLGLAIAADLLLVLLTHSAGMAAGLTLSGLSLTGLLRHRALQKTPAARSQTWGVVGLAIGLFVRFMLIPQSFPELAAPDNAQFWTLPNGSRIAYVHLAAAHPVGPPIVFLHGGPGLGLSLTSDLNFFAQFAAAGYDVYKYDQIGSGFSGRLADVRQYTIDRQVEDLEWIRQQIGAAQLIVWGQSWGGSLAQNYLARYPNRVAKLILTSSGQYWWSWQPEPIHLAALVNGRLSLRQRLGYAIVAHDPIAAAQLMTQTEGGYAWAAATDGLRFLPQINYCPGNIPPAQGISWVELADRVNIIVNRRITASVTEGSSPRAALRGLSTPVLYLRGRCDFPFKRATIRELVDLLPNIRLVQIAHVSHKLWNAPHTALVAPTILAFLHDRTTLPLPTVTAETWVETAER